MNKRLLPTLSIILGITGLAAVVDEAAAAITDFAARDFATAGDGLLTVDRLAGREWLDLTQSTNLSFLDVTDAGGAHNCNPTCSIGPFQGFTFAPLVDIQTVFTNAELPLFMTVGIDTPIGQDIVQFIDLFGDTAAAAGRGFSRTGGIGNDPRGTSTSLAFARADGAVQARTATISLFSSQARRDEVDGVWLYRGATPAPVPVPAALVLFPFALAALGLVARRRK